MFHRIKKYLTHDQKRHDFVLEQLNNLPASSLLLDAGCGSQQYRSLCKHLVYKAQDFGLYKNDSGPGFASGMGGDKGYEYGELDYVGDIWRIPERDCSFDAILCTEVFEHIPYPNETVKEFSRLLKPNGKLILTVPSNCLRHMDPYFFYSGFSDRYLQSMLSINNLKIESIEFVGDYYSWLALELARTIKNHSFIAAFLLLPAFVWFKMKKPTQDSLKTLCFGYHVLATKI